MYLTRARCAYGVVRNCRRPFVRFHHHPLLCDGAGVPGLRGKGMAIRAREAAGAAKTETDEYIREAAGCSPAQEIADAKTLLDARHDHPTGIRTEKSQSAPTDLAAAASGRVLAMAELRSGASITHGAAQVRDPSYQTGTRTPRSRPSNSVPPPLNRVLCRAISRKPRMGVGPERRNRATALQCHSPKQRGCADFGSAATTLACLANQQRC